MHPNRSNNISDTIYEFHPENYKFGVTQHAEWNSDNPITQAIKFDQDN
jgi:hypothetical protein